MTGRLTRSVDGSEAAGMKLVMAVLSAVAESDAEVPRPWTTSVAQRTVIDGAGVMWVVPEDDEPVQRIIALGCPCSCAEVTSYRDGVEVGRFVGRVG